MTGSLREGRILVEREARYFMFDDPEREDETPWVLFHGYGQRADRFLQECRPLAEESGGAMVAPEGLSRFYRRSGRGELGASWMTKLMREEEISEYISMIDRVLDDCGIAQTKRLNLLGFSQGGATAMRYALRSGRPVGWCVLWGAGFEDAELEEYREELGQVGETILVFGESDRIVERSVCAGTRDAILRSGGVVSLKSHPGGHELAEELLRTLGRAGSIRSR